MKVTFLSQITTQRELHTLMIPEAFREDAGNYMVKATNSAGEAKCYATLVIKQSVEKHMMKTRLVESSHTLVTEQISGHTPPEFRKLFNDMRVSPGESCRLQVTITGVPKPKVHVFANCIDFAT
jgi:titin